MSKIYRSTAWTRFSGVVNQAIPGDKEKHGNWQFTFCGRVYDNSHHSKPYEALRIGLDVTFIGIGAIYWAWSFVSLKTPSPICMDHCRSSWIYDCYRAFDFCEGQVTTDKRITQNPSARCYKDDAQTEKTRTK